MSIETLLDICEAYAGLGDAVASQLRDVVNDADSIDEQNPHALKLAADRFLYVALRAAKRADDDELVDELTDLIESIETPRAHKDDECTDCGMPLHNGGRCPSCTHNR